MEGFGRSRVLENSENWNSVDSSDALTAIEEVGIKICIFVLRFSAWFSLQRDYRINHREAIFPVF